MRARTKADDVLEEIDFSVDVTGFPREENIEKIVTFTKRSILADDTWRGFKPVRKCPKPEHPCEHVKVESKCSGVWPTINHSWYYPGLTIKMEPNRAFRMPAFTLPDLPDVEPDFRQFNNNSAVDMQQQFRDGPSLANFIAELKDFKGEFEDFSQIVTEKTGASIKKVLKSQAQSRIESGIGGNYLDWQFNWKQLIKDIPGIAAFYNKTMDRLQILIGHSQFHDHRRIRFTREVDKTPILVLDVANFSGYEGFQYELELVPHDVQVTFNCNALIKNDVHLDSANLWFAMADTLGLNNSPKILWNATKLSWLVEYLWDSRTFFDAFEKEAYKGALALLGGTCSKKLEQEFTVQIRKSVEGGVFVTNMGSLVVTHYERRLLIPVKPGFFETKSSLSSDQGKILAGLVDTRLGSFSTGAIASLVLDKAQKAHRKRNPRRQRRAYLSAVRILTSSTSNQRVRPKFLRRR